MSGGDKPQMPDGDLPEKNEIQAPAPKNLEAEAEEALFKGTGQVPRNDSFNVPVKKNVIMVWALLNVGLVTFMAILFYVLYQSRQN